MTITQMDTEQVRDLVAPLWSKHRGLILERLVNIHDALTVEGGASAAVRADLRALAGTLGTYGYPDGSDLAERILSALADDGKLGDPTLIVELEELLGTLSMA